MPQTSDNITRRDIPLTDANGDTQTCMIVVVTAPIGLTNRVASEAFLPTNHHALPTQPARSPKGPKPRERGQAHATQNTDEMGSRAVGVLVDGH